MLSIGCGGAPPAAALSARSERSSFGRKGKFPFAFKLRCVPLEILLGMLSIGCGGAPPAAALSARSERSSFGRRVSFRPQKTAVFQSLTCQSSVSALGTTLRAKKRCLPCSATVKDGNHSANSNEERVTIVDAEVLPLTTRVTDVDVEMKNANGKLGMVTFHNEPSVEPEVPTALSSRSRSLLWILSPIVLVSSGVIPPYAFRVLFEAIFDDSVITDFLVLFVAEAHFYMGAAAFLAAAERFRGTVVEPAGNGAATARYTWGYGVLSTLVTLFSIGVASACFYFGWKYTGLAAIAALVPYLLGIVIQAVIEKLAQNRPAVRPLIPVIFQLYRLHQLNRAAQLIAGLMFSMKGVEAVNKAAINSSLRMLVATVQLLGVLSLWSLAAFMTQSSSAWYHGKGISLVPL